MHRCCTNTKDETDDEQPESPDLKPVNKVTKNSTEHLYHLFPLLRVLEEAFALPTSPVPPINTTAAAISPRVYCPEDAFVSFTGS